MKRVVMLYHDALEEHQDDESDAPEEESEVGILHFLNLFSDLVALLPDEIGRAKFCARWQKGCRITGRFR